MLNGQRKIKMSSEIREIMERLNNWLSCQISKLSMLCLFIRKKINKNGLKFFMMRLRDL